MISFLEILKEVTEIKNQAVGKGYGKVLGGLLGSATGAITGNIIGYNVGSLFDDSGSFGVDPANANIGRAIGMTVGASSAAPIGAIIGRSIGRDLFKNKNIPLDQSTRVERIGASLDSWIEPRSNKNYIVFVKK